MLFISDIKIYKLESTKKLNTPEAISNKTKNQNIFNWFFKEMKTQLALSLFSRKYLEKKPKQNGKE